MAQMTEGEAATPPTMSEEISASIFEAALDCILTMDDHGRVIDLNPAAEETFGYVRDEVRGRQLAELIIPPESREAHQRARRRYVETGRATILGRRLELTAMRSDGSLLPVELTVTRLGTHDPPTFAGFVRDLTARRRSDERIAQLLEREQDARIAAEAAERSARRVSETLQRSLLPPHLPHIPGARLAAAYEAADERSMVGGDFYDVFPVGEHRWGVVVGDVSGKGADAASLTALARYTLRAAAVQQHEPRAVLSIVNQAFLAEPRDNAYCTLAYATLGVTGSQAVMRLAVAGHPPPLLARRDGELETIGRSGTMLGAGAEATFEDVELILGEGETLLLYTDGVTEAHTRHGRLGVEGLVSMLRRRPAERPEDLIAGVIAGLHEGEGHRVTDDVALLAVNRPPSAGS